MTEAACAIGVFALLPTGAPVWLLVACVAAMNVVAWTGYAGMRAEVAAVAGRSLTWYGPRGASRRSEWLRSLLAEG